MERSREEAFENHRVRDEIVQNKPDQNTEFRVGGLQDYSMTAKGSVQNQPHPDS